MTDTDVRDRPTRLRRLARPVTEAFAPAVWAAAMPLIVALHSSPTLPAALGWSVLAIVFSSLIPYGVIWLGVRRGTLTDHHIGRREQRRAPLLAGLASVLIGLTALIMLHGPQELVAMVVVMLVVLLGTTVINQFWKLSAHTAVSAGSVAVLVVLFGPPMVAAALLVGAIGWSRVVLRDHTTAQVLTGAGVGVVLASICFLLIAP
ncbi:MAG: hypothetical protein HKP61_10600 [Dactylosporangium sp.]|nr:hypothetical protein [Dactylosporangium sp.]NNJ61378.1 hypothetical protein [Dactylosporangium sp.]